MTRDSLSIEVSHEIWASAEVQELARCRLQEQANALRWFWWVEEISTVPPTGNKKITIHKEL